MTMRRRLLKSVKILLWQMSHSPWYIPLVGLVCVLAGATLAMPILALVVVAVILRPQRWRTLCVVCSLGAGIGAAILVHFMHSLGVGQIQTLYPELGNSTLWRQTLDWTREYGLFALAAVAALPMPQTPALVASTLSHLPIPGILAAVILGKLVKYGIVAWMVATFPERFIHYLHRDEGGKPL